ncbi:MAG: helix-turn-helix domain-containing protein, partial [Firmicutes bacterium]|nr:helix-turn-helix domain-containing protein [Bacillota bacterium]
AEYERELIRERTLAGLAAARKKGRVGGRPSGLSKEARNKAIAAKHLYIEEKKPVKEILKSLDISRATLYRYLRYMNVTIG